MAHDLDYFENDSIFTAVVTGQEVIEAALSHNGEKHAVPQLVLKCELRQKLDDPKRPYGKRLDLPEGADRDAWTRVNFWPVDDEPKQYILAAQCEALQIPDGRGPEDLARPDDGSAPNVDLTGREIFLKVRQYAGRSGVAVGFDIKRFPFGPPEPPRKPTADLFKAFRRHAGPALAEKRKELREGKEGQDRKTQAALATLEPSPF